MRIFYIYLHNPFSIHADHGQKKEAIEIASGAYAIQTCVVKMVSKNI